MTAPAIDPRVYDAWTVTAPAEARPDPRAERDAAWLSRPFDADRFRLAARAVVLRIEDNRKDSAHG